MIAEWQKKLGLLGWRVAFRIISRDEEDKDYIEMRKNGWRACNTTNIDASTATIRIMQQNEWVSDDGIKYVASGIVHELLHISLIEMTHIPRMLSTR